MTRNGPITYNVVDKKMLVKSVRLVELEFITMKVPAKNIKTHFNMGRASLPDLSNKLLPFIMSATTTYETHWDNMFTTRAKNVRQARVW